MAKKQQTVAHDGLLQAIGRSPEDDAPRLVYADWLEEQGAAEHAEFIRVQCELARLARDDARSQPLREREAELLALHGEAWRPSLPARGRSCIQFRRGFPVQVATTARRFLRQGKVLRRRVPLESLILRECTGLGSQLLASGLLEGVRHLDLGNFLTEEDGLALARSPALAGLRGLDLFNNQFQPDTWRLLVTSPYLGQLTSFFAAQCPKHLAAILVRHAAWPGLERLRLSFNGLTPALMAETATSPR